MKSRFLCLQGNAPLALGLAFCSMATVFILKTYADASFLTLYGASRLPELFIFQSLVLIIFSLGYGTLVRYFRPLVLDLLLIGGLILCALVAPFLIRDNGSGSFILILLLLVLPAATHLALWNTVSSTVSGRQSRRFLPRAGAAATLGAVLGSLVASFLIEGLSVQGLTPFAALVGLLLLLVRMLLQRRIPPPPRHLKPKDKRSDPSETLAPPMRRLVLFLVLATLLEAFAAAIIEYGFKREASLHFDLTELAHFLAIFYLATNTLLLLLQWFGTATLLTVRPLRQTLALTPVTLVLSGLFWVFWPGLIIASMARMTESTIKFGVARPAQEIALLPLTPLDRARWKVWLRGIIVQAGSAIAGIGLFFWAPLVETQPRLLSGILILLCLLWLLAQRQCARAYLEAMGSALGLRKLSPKRSTEQQLFDRDGLANLVQLLDQSDLQQAQFAQEVLASSEHQAKALIPHLANAGPQGRYLLYQMIAAQPTPGKQTALLVAVQQETQPKLLACGLDALAAHHNPGAIPQAKKLIQLDQNPALHGWEYLAHTGALKKCKQLQEAPPRLLAKDGRKAAWLLRMMVNQGCIDHVLAEQMILTAIANPDTTHHTEGFRAAAAYDHSQTQRLFTEGLISQDIAIPFALPSLPFTSLAKLVAWTHTQNNSAPRATLVSALQHCSQEQSVELTISFLTDPNKKVRHLARRALRKQQDKSGAEISWKYLDSALQTYLNWFLVYVQGYQKSNHPTAKDRLFAGELCLKRNKILVEICALLALMGDPRSIQAAQRGLIAGDTRYQRRCLDILQEVVHGHQRKRLIHLLEGFIDPPQWVDPAALLKVCAMDSWLAQCHAGQVPVERLLALRSTALFTDIDNDALLEIATQSTKWSYLPDQLVVCQGEIGHALYTVLSGRLGVEKDGQHLRTLGPFDSFGELALLDHGLRKATIRTLEPTELLCIPGSVFKQILQEYPSFGINICKILAKWARSDGR